jgi:glycosyltransferase involved in cell wall biosynthesis
VHIGFIAIESPFDASGGGGISAYMRAMIPALVHEGHRVTVFVNDRSASNPTQRDPFVRIVPVRLPNLHWYGAKVPGFERLLALPLRQVEWSAAFYWSVRTASREDALDIIEGAGLGDLFLSLRHIAPMVIRLHGSSYLFRKYTGQPLDPGTRAVRQLEKLTWQRASALTSPTHFQAGEVSRELGSPSPAITVIPNPIAPEVLAAALTGHPVRTDDPMPIVLYTGRLAPVKGTEPFLAAAQLVRSAAPDTRFVLAGSWQMSGSPSDWGLQTASEASSPGSFWLGHVPWHDLTKWYRQASIFVMPSYYESFGISVVEAMAFGLPVVATTAGGLPEVVQDGVTGILVPPGDAPALADAITCLIRDPALRRRLGAAGRERVRSHFTVDAVVNETLRVYRSFIAAT